MDSRRYWSTTYPSLASLMAGSITCAKGSRPNRWCISSSPAGEPGTAAASAPVTLRSVGSPSGSRYMSREAPEGAISR